MLDLSRIAGSIWQHGVSLSGELLIIRTCDARCRLECMGPPSHCLACFNLTVLLKRFLNVSTWLLRIDERFIRSTFPPPLYTPLSVYSVTTIIVIVGHGCLTSLRPSAAYANRGSRGLPWDTFAGFGVNWFFDATQLVLLSFHTLQLTRWSCALLRKCRV